MVDHFEELADRFLVDQQARQAEDVPGGIVLMDGHFNITFFCGGNYSL